MDLFLSILKSVIYGVIEGITEWLPISSTGHMILAEQVLKFGYTEDFMEMFRVVIQLGAILAVVVLYFHKLWPFCKDNGRDTGFAAHLRWPVVRLWFKIIAAGKGNTNGGHKQQCSQAHSARHGLVERLFHGADLLYGVTSPR